MYRQSLKDRPLELKVAMLAALALILSACAPKMEEMAAEPEPMEEPAMEEPEPAPLVASEDIYVVSAGDNLWNISGSASIYNDPFRWPLLYGRNKDIEDADLIYPDQRLYVPRDLMRGDIDSAIEHAKNRGAWSVGEVEESDLNYRAASM